MELGIIVMLAIIVLDVLVMVFVMRVGSKHDKHNETDSVGSSDALARMQQTGMRIVTHNGDCSAQS